MAHDEPTGGWLDVSVPIETGMNVYPGDPPVRVTRHAAIAAGAPANVSHLDLGAHSGTHVDAPVHFFEGAEGVDRLPLGSLIGPAWVVDATRLPPHARQIDEALLDGLEIPAEETRVLFRTTNSQLWERDTFVDDYIGLTDGAAAELVRRGVRLVGIDYLSIAPRRDPAPTHRVLLAASVVVVEGLDLRTVAPGGYELMCLPLRIAGCDGAPARVLLRARHG